MNRLVICLACSVSLIACHSNVSELKEAEKISKTVAAQFVPDSREDIYQIHFMTKGSSLVASGETTNSEAKQALLSSLINASIAVTDSISVLPDPNHTTKTWGLVNVSVCNIRTTPANSAEMASQAILGTPVRILKKTGSWYMIQTPDLYIGWVDDDAIFQTDSAEMAAWRENKRVVYIPLEGTGIHPETRETVTDLVAGNILKSDTLLKNEYLLRMPDGRELAISANNAIDFDIWKNNAEQTAATLSTYAKSLAGRPYLWGGTSTKGVDCSGFVKTVYFLNGIILARDASLQFRHGAYTDPQSGYKKLNPGDLVFFGKKAEGDRPAKATHVGFYLGNGEYINASGYVRTDSFDPEKNNFAKKRTDTWLGGRTILGSEGERGIVRVKDHPWY